ncbi:MAG: hypothetical protein ACW99A_20185 [Candidatus Kariarchaeaceae archaeon]|jgi:hypothetical protein
MIITSLAVEISRIIGSTLKKPPSKEYIDSFKLLIRGGFVKVLENNSFVFSTTMNKTLHNLSNLILDCFHDFSPISFYPKYSKEVILEFLDSEVSSYKQLPVKTKYQANLSNSNYSMKLGLLYPQISEIIGLYQIYSNNVNIDNVITDLEATIYEALNSLKIPVTNYISVNEDPKGY